MIICKVLLYLLHIQEAFSQIACKVEEECVGNAIISTSLEQIGCWGYRSCLGATNIRTNRYGAGCSICCYGSYSCFNAATIQRTVTTPGEIWCGGLLSCAFVSNLDNKRGVVSCSGEQSCRGATITLRDDNVITNRHMACTGDHSCMNANVSTRDETYFGGHLSGLNSVFYGNYSTVRYLFTGSNSGYNTTIICGVGNTCSVTCWGNGCNKLTLSCSDESDASCTFDVNCTYAEKSENNNVCPNGMYA